MVTQTVFQTGTIFTVTADCEVTHEDEYWTNTCDLFLRWFEAVHAPWTIQTPGHPVRKFGAYVFPTDKFIEFVRGRFISINGSASNAPALNTVYRYARITTMFFVDKNQVDVEYFIPRYHGGTTLLCTETLGTWYKK